MSTTTTQFTLGLPGFAPEEAPARKGIEMRHFACTGARIYKPVVSNGRLIGETARGDLLPVFRSISYDLDGTRHKCNSSCQHAKGPDCECSCGGAFHGKARLAGARLFI